MRYQFFWDLTLSQYLVPGVSIQHNILSSRVEDGTIIPSCNINNQIQSDAVSCSGTSLCHATSFLTSAVHH